MRQVALHEFTDLMREFADGRTDGSEFETRYLRLFKEDESMRPEPIFRVLDGIFGDVDAFSADPALRGTDGLDEPTLRDHVAAALQKLAGLAG